MKHTTSPPPPDRARPAPAPSALLLLTAAALGACSRGSGAPEFAGGGGSYTTDEFGYEDPHDPGFHPLGSDRTLINDLAEQLVLVPYDRSLSGAGTGGEETLVWIDESAREGFAQVPGPPNLFGSDLAVRGVAAGALDDDPAAEWVAVEVDDDGHELVLHTADRGEDGSVRTAIVQRFDPGSFQARDATVELADLDGDGRDELIVVARQGYSGNPTTDATVRVLDDPEAGCAELLRVTIAEWHTGIWALPGDVDGDGRIELVLAYALGTYPDAKHEVQVLAWDADARRMGALFDWQTASEDAATYASKPALGDFDGDGRDELAVAKTFELGAQMVVQLHEWDERGVLRQRQWALVPDVGTPADVFWTLASFDRRVGQDELAVLVPHASGARPWRLNLLTYDPVGDTWSLEQKDLVHTFDGQLPALCAGDIDADGAEELQWGLLRGQLSEATLWRGYLDDDPGEGLKNFPVRTFFGNEMRSRAPILVNGDWDADGLLVEYTGRKELQLERPIPLALLSAPPTQAGSDQNVADTTSRFETGLEQSETWAVLVGTTVTESGGVGLELPGLFRAGGMATLERTIERSAASTSRVHYVSGYTGTAAADTIVFQGTLRQSYEYVILAAPDPDAIGAFVTLDLPVDAKVYNWTVDYYNTKVAPEDRIPAELLTHTPGRVDTYPDFHELQESLTGSLHWISPTEQDVGQGAGSNDQEIAFVEESTTEEQRTLSVTLEGELSLGAGLQLEGAAAETATTGALYSVTFTESTRFTTTIGAIEDPAAYEQWRYAWGLALQTYGRAADPDNNPTATSTDHLPFLWVRYWVTPTGTGSW